MWFGVAPRMETKKTLLKRDWIVCSKEMLTIISSVVSIIDEWMGGLMQPFNEHLKLRK